MEILGWILFGLIVGAVAKFIMPGRDPGGIIVTILLGIAGALLGGFGRVSDVVPRRGRAAGALPGDGTSACDSVRECTERRSQGFSHDVSRAPWILSLCLDEPNLPRTRAHARVHRHP